MLRKCQVCGAEFTAKPSRLAIGKGKFCSLECYRASRRKASGFRVRPDGAIEVELTRGQRAIIDADDLPKIAPYKWSAHLETTTGGYYAVHSPRKGDTSPVQMSRLILGATGDIRVDHRNHDTLDNRRDNLRLCTGSENVRNASIRKNKVSSRYKGVGRYGRHKRWEARIGFNKQIISVGYFDTEVEAARAYNAAAIKYFGEFACLNEIPE